MTRVGDQVHTWDVINEAVSDFPNQQFVPSGINEPKISNIVCKIFKKAKQVRQNLNAPQMRLALNDYDHASINSTKSEKVFNLVKNLKNNNCGIDTVGFELHIDKNFEDFSGVRANINRYRDIGIKVHFTEVEVRCGVIGNVCEIDETDPDAIWTHAMLEKQQGR